MPASIGQNSIKSPVNRKSLTCKVSIPYIQFQINFAVTMYLSDPPAITASKRVAGDEFYFSLVVVHRYILLI